MQLLILLSPAQVSKLNKMESVNVNMKPSNNKQMYIVEFNDHKEAKHVFLALHAGKGVKLNGTKVDNVLHSGEGIKSAFKRLGRTIKKGIVQTGDAIKETAFDTNRALKNSSFGRSVVKAVVPGLAGEVTGLITKQGITYLTGSSDLGGIAGNAVNRGMNAIAKTGLRKEGYGLKRIRHGINQPMAEGGAIEPLENLVPNNVNLLAGSKRVASQIAHQTKIESFANDPKLTQPKINLQKVNVNLNRAGRKVRGKGFKGYGKGLVGYGK